MRLLKLTTSLHHPEPPDSLLTIPESAERIAVTLNRCVVRNLPPTMSSTQATDDYRRYRLAMDIWPEVKAAYQRLSGKSGLSGQASRATIGIIQDQVTKLTVAFSSKMPNPLPEYSVGASTFRLRSLHDGSSEFKCRVMVSWPGIDGLKKMTKSLVVPLPPPRPVKRRELDLPSWRVFRHTALPLAAQAPKNELSDSLSLPRQNEELSGDSGSTRQLRPRSNESRHRGARSPRASATEILEAQRTQWVEVCQRAMKSVIAAAHEEVMTQAFLDKLENETGDDPALEDRRADRIFEQWAKQRKDTSDFDKAVGRFAASAYAHDSTRPADDLPVVITHLEPEWQPCTSHASCMTREVILTAQHSHKVKVKQDLHTAASLFDRKGLAAGAAHREVYAAYDSSSEENPGGQASQCALAVEDSDGWRSVVSIASNASDAPEEGKVRRPQPAQQASESSRTLLPNSSRANPQRTSGSTRSLRPRSTRSQRKDENVR